MPEIIFDPPRVSWKKYLNRGLSHKKQRGGAPVQRSAYMELCKAITSRDPSLDYTKLRDEILRIMQEDVIAYIHTLPRDEQPPLLADIETFYTGFDKTDNHFNCINIIALQTCILFTKYHHDKLDPEIDPEEFHFPTQEEFGLTTYADYIDFIRNPWKSYNDLKTEIRRSADFRFIVSGPEHNESIFMAFIGFLKLGELMESVLDNVFFCALTYKTELVDGTEVSPMSALWHDGGSHYINFIGCYKYPTIFKEFREFHKYVSTHDKPTQYAINFVLFLLLHENPYCDREEMRENSLNTPYFNRITEPFLYSQLKRHMYVLKHINIQGLAIPREFRIADPEDDKKLNVEKIEEYLHIVSQIYITVYREYEAQKLRGGGKTRKSPTSKRLRKTRRAG